MKQYEFWVDVETTGTVRIEADSYLEAQSILDNMDEEELKKLVFGEGSNTINVAVLSISNIEPSDWLLWGEEDG